MNLQSNDFELFAIPEQFVQDRGVLDARWKELQREAHPDKFAAQGAAAQRVAMQWSVRINEAYQRLKDPLNRAAYLCELHGASINAATNTAMPAEFLMQQMAWREAMDDAKTVKDFEEIGSKSLSVKNSLLEKCEQLLDHEHNYPAAVTHIRALMFIEKFTHDLHQRIDLIA